MIHLILILSYKFLSICKIAKQVLNMLYRPIILVMPHKFYFVSKLHEYKCSQTYWTVSSMLNKYMISLLLKYIIHVFHPFNGTPISKMFERNIKQETYITFHLLLESVLPNEMANDYSYNTPK